jgi:hypothetical protein
MRPTVTYGTSPHKEWERARRRGFVQEILAAFTRRPADLMRFDEVYEKLDLRIMADRGLQPVPLDQIVGSVGRYQDFTRAFFPRQAHLGDRWKRIEEMVVQGRELPPVDLYKVGGAYFVRDGNHRVSVARQHGRSMIDASVWEYETDVPLGPDDDVDEVLCRAAQAEFVQQTHIEDLCPELRVRLTQFVGYQDLLCEIASFQQVVSHIDRREVAFDEAVQLWAQLRYRPIVDIIRRQHVLDAFPGRTEADLYLWLCRHQAELESHHGQHVLMEQAADDLAKRSEERFLSARSVKLALRVAAFAALSRAVDGWNALRRWFSRWWESR